MSAPTPLPAALRWIVARVVPAERMDDVLGDVEATHRDREVRLGKARARALLWREVGSLLLWRFRSGLRREGAAAFSIGETTGRAAAPGGSLARSGAHPRGGLAPGRAPRASDLWSDLRFAARALARRPAFALTAAGVLALGIGSVTTVFTLVERIYFDPPAGVAEPERLVRIFRAWEDGTRGGSLSHADFVHYQTGASALAGVLAYGETTELPYTLAAGEPDQLTATFVSGGYFEVLGVLPALGRFFRPEEDGAPGTHLVTVLSDGYWRRALGGDPGVIGRTLSINGQAFTVVGVAPERFQGASPIDEPVDAWLPIASYGTLADVSDLSWWERVPGSSMNWLTVVGRLATGTTAEAAQANLSALSDALRFEGRNPTETIELSSQYLYSPGQANTLAKLSRLLLAAVAVVLVIAVANVSLLALLRTATRGPELGIRTSVGASRARIVRLIFAESLVLSLAGGALGVTLAFVAGDVVASLLPYTFASTFTPDARVAAATFLISLVVASAVGLAPGLQVARGDLKAVIDAGRHARAGGRLRDALVIGQVGLSLVMVAGAALFAQSFLTARGEDLGFEVEDRLVLELDLGSQGYDDARGRVFMRDALERLNALPGVVDASTTVMIPFQGEWTTELKPPPGAQATEPDGSIVTGANLVGPGYFEVMGIEIVRGRPLQTGDDASGPPVVVINEALARSVWPNQDALGKSLPMREGIDFTVVGIAHDATYYELGEEPRLQAYGSIWQAFMPAMSFVMHTDGAAAELAQEAQAALRALDPALAFRQISTLETVRDAQVARYRVTAALVGIFGVLALVLSSAGLYALVAYVVAGRTKEIGLRMALGADRRRVAADVLARAVLLACVGVLVGIVGAVSVRRFAAGLLYGVAPNDPVPLVLGGSVLLLVAALAALGPARRAMRVSPMDSLRAE